ncbi:MAG TPA: hypothetical protein VK607_18175, partial [Kofleriaceae bacterium]|nr:hypothetical protein [Kofleriaceae bacterium]
RLPATLDRRAFDAACSWHRRATISYAAAGVGLLGSVISTIVLLRDPGPADTTAARPSRVAVAPIVTPAGGGAALSLAW